MCIYSDIWVWSSKRYVMSTNIELKIPVSHVCAGCYLYADFSATLLIDWNCSYKKQNILAAVKMLEWLDLNGKEHDAFIVMGGFHCVMVSTLDSESSDSSSNVGGTFMSFVFISKQFCILMWWCNMFIILCGHVDFVFVFTQEAAEHEVRIDRCKSPWDDPHK